MFVPGFIILLGSFLLLNLINQTIQQFFPYYIAVVHSGTNLEFSIILGFTSLGAFIGGIVASIKKYWNPTILMFFISVCIIMTGNLIIALTPYRSFYLLIINNLIMSSFLIIPQTIFLSIMQTNIPKQQIGRVYGIYLTISSFISLLVGYFSGPFIEVFNVRNSFLVISVIGIIVFLLIFFLSVIKSINYNNFIAQVDYFQVEK